MIIISPTQDRTIRTTTAVMYGLAAPSQGSDQVATEKVSAGQALVVPAGSVRQFRSTGEPLEALVAMQAGARVSVPGTEGANPIPWAV
ncbi:MAG TPA: hypothetical protein VGG75_09435 [Trebonia sp.]|jgi:hypothetical protein